MVYGSYMTHSGRVLKYISCSFQNDFAKTWYTTAKADYRVDLNLHGIPVPKSNLRNYHTYYLMWYLPAGYSVEWA